jgi:L-ascorbate metabolism protein UlaG (beta-lactamase superfamily)
MSFPRNRALSFHERKTDERRSPRPRPRARPGGCARRNVTTVRVTHIGGPTALIEVEGWRLLTDPTFDDPGRTYHFGWGTGSRKVSGPAVAVADIGPIDAVLLTHDQHADNLDDAGRAFLPSAGVVITTASGAARLGGATRGLETWATTSLEHAARPSIEITATPCRHGPPLSHALVGDVVGFALRWDGQKHGVLWISGDTVFYDGVREVADQFDVGLALLHLGSAQFPVTGPVRYTMTVQNAIKLCRSVRPRTAVPVHYEGWSHFRQGRAAIEEALALAPGDVSERFRLLKLGVATDLET